MEKWSVATNREIDLTGTVEHLSNLHRRQNRERFEFESVAWADGVIKVTGKSGPTAFVVSLTLTHQPPDLISKCSVCRGYGKCVHAIAAIVLLDDYEIAADIEQNDYAPASYSLTRKKPRDPWKSRLGNLVEQLRHHVPTEAPPAKFPAGRELIYVIQRNSYHTSDEKLHIGLATRPAPQLPGQNLPVSTKLKKSKNVSRGIYRRFTGGLRGWAASPDPIDRELAAIASMVTDSTDYYGSRYEQSLTLSIENSSALIAKLARSGKLYVNSYHEISDDIVQLGWISDEKFDLKFEVIAHENDRLRLGICAVSPEITLSLADLKIVAPYYLIDAKNRLGLFRNEAPTSLLHLMTSTDPIDVPRKHATDLIEKLMNLPAGLGIKFTGCEDIQPRRISSAPRPRVQIKESKLYSDSFEAHAQMDYDGILIPLLKRTGEFFDKTRGSIVQIDTAFHDQCQELLTSIGVRSRQGYQGFQLTLLKKKLPEIVQQLIKSGWHVEAEGKLYRTASSFKMDVVSGIDWFELNGKATFDQTEVDLPRLIQSLRAGEQSVVLDDGTIGVIPEDWVKRFSSLANLATSEDGSLKFGRSQVGLLDALLAEQGEVNVDEKFAAARESLRRFDRIQPQEAPAGFVGLLRPYQKLAQGWFEFLRNMGFGGCLADDMGLGKTIQVLSLLEHRRQLNSGPSVIVVPRSLIFNWTAEAKKFAPQLRVLDQSHSQRQKGTDHLRDFDLVLTTYGTLRRDAAFLKDFEFDYVVLDEAQAIKNANTEAAKAARLLKGRHKLALSGTPIENHLGELWSLFDFLNPGMLGRIGRFAGMAREADEDQRKMLGAAVRPFILRRTKKQVAPELPDRVEQTVVVELDAEQRRSYNELRDYYRQKLLNKIDTDGIGKSQIVILEALLRLRQAACHPGLIDKARIGEPSAKVDELVDRLTSASETGERVLVFSQFTSLLAIVKVRLKAASIPFLYLDGKTKNRQELVDQFQSGTGPAVFLISLKAGGVGLNLTAARSVYLLDPWWNPAVEAQAIDRAHRIGQQQTVFATRLITADTVEQKVLELQAKKKGLADAIVNADNSGLSSLTKEDLELLLA
jgi:hypothetical protein